MPKGVYPRRPLTDRLFEKILVSETGCLIWLGTRSGRGYGTFHLNGRNVAAHRVVYERVYGPIPDGLLPDHLCRVRLCVNPRHIELVTNKVNLLRGDAPPAWNARKTVCSKGHPFVEENITHDNGHRKCRTCNREYARRYKERLRSRKQELPK